MNIKWNYDIHGEIVNSICPATNTPCAYERGGHCPQPYACDDYFGDTDIEITDKGFYVELDENGEYVIVDSLPEIIKVDEA